MQLLPSWTANSRMPEGAKILRDCESFRLILSIKNQCQAQPKFTFRIQGLASLVLAQASFQSNTSFLKQYFRAPQAASDTKPWRQYSAWRRKIKLGTLWCFRNPLKPIGRLWLLQTDIPKTMPRMVAESFYQIFRGFRRSLNSERYVNGSLTRLNRAWVKSG